MPSVGLSVVRECVRVDGGVMALVILCSTFCVGCSLERKNGWLIYTLIYIYIYDIYYIYFVYIIYYIYYIYMYHLC